VRAIQIPSRVLRAGWLVVAVALVIVLGFWAFQIAGALHTTRGDEALPSPTPVKAIPTVVTESPDAAPLTPSQLCAQLAPGTNEVIVQTTLGVPISTLQC
jgi:hypothetical protein